MKKILYYIPFIAFMTLYLAVICIGGLSFEYTVFLFLAALLCAGMSAAMTRTAHADRTLIFITLSLAR